MLWRVTHTGGSNTKCQLYFHHTLYSLYIHDHLQALDAHIFALYSCWLKYIRFYDMNLFLKFSDSHNVLYYRTNEVVINHTSWRMKHIECKCMLMYANNLAPCCVKWLKPKVKYNSAWKPTKSCSARTLLLDAAWKNPPPALIGHLW